jgi:hypothetical protein
MSTPCLDDPESILAMRRRHAEIGMRMQAVALHALEELERKVVSGQPLGLSADDAKTLLDAGAALERAAMGEKESARDKKKLN